jgi:hypothetical protein
MGKCKECGSFAINHNQHGRDGSDPDLCDVCYWRKRAKPALVIIDRETAIQWANEAGMINFGGANWQCVTDQIQQIITRAQNEAYEAAAKIAETPISGEQDDITMEAKDRAAKEIRSMKQAEGVKNDS